MTVAQEWLEAALNRSTSNDAGKLALDPELLPHLNRIYQRFYAIYAKARPDEAASVITVSLGGVPASAGLPVDVIAVTDVRDGAGNIVHLIPATETTKLWHLAPSVYRVGARLYSRQHGGDPVPGDTLTLSLLDAPTGLTALSSFVDVRYPTRHHQLCIDALALYLDTKDDGRSGDAHAKLLSEYQTALATFAAEYELPPSALEWAHAPSQRSSIGQAGAQ